MRDQLTFGGAGSPAPTDPPRPGDVVRYFAERDQRGRPVGRLRVGTVRRIMPRAGDLIVNVAGEQARIAPEAVSAILKRAQP